MPEISVQISPAVADRLREAAERDSRLSSAAVSLLARQAVAAWSSAADGDDSALIALGGPGAPAWLTQPVNDPATRLSPGARVTAIEISGVGTHRGAARLGVRFEFTGHWPGAGDEEFTGFLTLDLDGTGNQPWRLTAGYLQRLSSWLGYQFTRRRETHGEYQQRTGSPEAPAAAPVPAGARHERVFRLTAGFAEHDERYGGSASVQVTRPVPPSRAEAEALIWPAVGEATARALGPGDWSPSLNWLEVTELRPGPA